MTLRKMALSAMVSVIFFGANAFAWPDNSSKGLFYYQALYQAVDDLRAAMVQANQIALESSALLDQVHAQLGRPVLGESGAYVPVNRRPRTAAAAARGEQTQEIWSIKYRQELAAYKTVGSILSAQLDVYGQDEIYLDSLVRLFNKQGGYYTMYEVGDYRASGNIMNREWKNVTQVLERHGISMDSHGNRTVSLKPSWSCLGFFKI